jgi:uncharacterized protein (TIGR02596 family)
MTAPQTFSICHPLQARRVSGGFSLVELLAVIAIIVAISAFAIPAANSLLRNSQMAQASQTLVDQLSLARQQAITKNKVVEVRFYRYADPEFAGEVSNDPTQWKFRGFQIMELSSTGIALPLSQLIRLPEQVVMADYGNLSTILSDPTQKSARKNVKDDTELQKTAPLLPRKIDHKYEYTWMRFYPDGSTNLSATGTTSGTGTGSSSASSGGRWFITLFNVRQEKALGKSGSEEATIPQAFDFFTVQVDPVSGTLRTYKP